MQKRRWVRALEIAKICFSSEGYHTRYLEEIENFINEHGSGKGVGITGIES